VWFQVQFEGQEGSLKKWLIVGWLIARASEQEGKASQREEGRVYFSG